MAGKSITWTGLAEAVCEQAGMTRGAAADLVDQVLEAIGRALERGESVKLSSFGVFRVRKRAPRIGRKEVPVATSKQGEAG